MGRNAEIKRFEAKRAGQSIDLFDAARTHLPVVAELLSTPWVRRGSDLVCGEGTGKLAEASIEVEWDGERARPAVFIYRGKRHVVDAVVQQWAVERFWWDHRRVMSRRCFRVLARGGVWDLAYDRIGEEWVLAGVLD